MKTYSQQEIKTTILLALSAYSTHKPYSAEDWLEAKRRTREEHEIKKKYKYLTKPNR